MAAVVNYLHFKEPIDPSVFTRSEFDLVPQMRAIVPLLDGPPHRHIGPSIASAQA